MLIKTAIIPSWNTTLLYLSKIKIHKQTLSRSNLQMQIVLNTVVMHVFLAAFSSAPIIGPISPAKCKQFGAARGDIYMCWVCNVYVCWRTRFVGADFVKRGRDH